MTGLSLRPADRGAVASAGRRVPPTRGNPLRPRAGLRAALLRRLPRLTPPTRRSEPPTAAPPLSGPITTPAPANSLPPPRPLALLVAALRPPPAGLPPRPCPARRRAAGRGRPPREAGDPRASQPRYPGDSCSGGGGGGGCSSSLLPASPQLRSRARLPAADSEPSGIARQPYVSAGGARASPAVLLTRPACAWRVASWGRLGPRTSEGVGGMSPQATWFVFLG